jgi:aldose 1-epimerase
MGSKPVGLNPLTKEPIYHQSAPMRRLCPWCGGSGRVACTYCSDGKDKELLGNRGETPAMNPNGLQRENFGTTSDGVPVDRYTLRNAGAAVRLITYGAAVTELWVPDRAGRTADVVLGFDQLASYEDPAKNPYFGATVGRVAFRITGGQFTLDGKPYHLTLNTPPHHLHGGVRGFSRSVWSAEAVPTADSPAVRFSLVSPDGDQGYPGNLKASDVYTLTPKGELRIEYSATTDRPTPVNLTHHSYFNLAGAGNGDVLGHTLQLAASQYTPLDEKKIPTGQVAAVEGTPFDFRRPTRIGDRIKTDPEVADGYDLSYPLEGADGSLRLAATLSEPTSGRVMEVWTTEPAIVLYTGNYLDGTVRGKDGVIYGKHAAVCLETAHLPDSVNQPSFPSTILRPNQTYRQTCVYRFTAR